jgi:hypothetical protein
MLTDWFLEYRLRAAVARMERVSRNKDVSSKETKEAYKTNLRIAAMKYRFVKREIDKRRSIYLHREAFRLDLEVPPFTDAHVWNQVTTSDGEKETYLTSYGRHEVRKLIDAEKARRFEVKTLWVTKFWLPLLAALIGIIGAATGLVAVLQHKK